MLFQKLEDSFLQICQDLYWDNLEPEFRDQNILAYIAHTSFTKLNSDLENIIVDIVASRKSNYFVKVELKSYFNYRRSIREPFLKLAFIDRITGNTPPENKEHEFWLKQLATINEGQRKELLKSWENTFERKIFITCLDAYEVCLDRLRNRLIEFNSEATEEEPYIDVITKAMDTKLFLLFRDKSNFRKFIEIIRKLDWIDDNLNWSKRSEVFLTPIARFLNIKNILNTNNATHISKAIKESFHTDKPEDSIRNITKVDNKSPNYKRVCEELSNLIP
jgi:hypothetical protein